MAKYSTLHIQEDKDAPKKKRDTRWSKPLNEQKDKDSGRGKEEGPDGVWRTVRGRHIFIEEGKTLEQALGHKPGVENQKKIEGKPKTFREIEIEKLDKINKSRGPMIPEYKRKEMERMQKLKKK